MGWILAIVAVAAPGAAVLFLAWYARRSDSWGATAEEVAATLPGDEWLEGGPPARARMTRAIWIEAPAETVWPFVAQMGRGAGWYRPDSRRRRRRILKFPELGPLIGLLLPVDSILLKGGSRVSAEIEN